MIRNYVLPLGGPLFHFAAGVLGRAEAFESYATRLVGFCFPALASGVLRPLLTLAPDRTEPAADGPPSARRLVTSVVVISSGSSRGSCPGFVTCFEVIFRKLDPSEVNL